MPGIDFDRLRAEITMQEVLELLGFQPHRGRGDQWYGCCPLPGLSAESTTLLLREREHGPVLLPSLSPSRRSARTLGTAATGLSLHRAAIDLCVTLGQDTPWIHRW